LTTAFPRVLLVTAGYPPAGTAGLERGCQRLAQALARRGLSVTVLTRAVSGLPRRERDETGVTVCRVLRPIALGRMWGASYAVQTASWLWRLRARWDLVFCQQLWLHSVAASVIARRLGKVSANLLVAADSYSDIDRLRRLRGGALLVRVALAADAHFALSRRSAAELRAAGVPPSRILPYRYFVDTDAFAPGGEASPVELLFMGRFDPQKNLSLLIDAFEQVAAAEPRARLRLVGRGPQESAVRARVAASPVGPRIAIESWTEDPASAYRRARAVVTASNAEGFSNVLIEAMACGAPVITTDVSGARDALDDAGQWPQPLPSGTYLAGQGGLLVNRGDAAGLTAAMLRVLRDDALRASLAQQARARVVSHYTEGVSVDAFVGNVRTLLSARNTGAPGAPRRP
jgi:glycosyltransferase involved in cell wall biosynthesis